MLKKSMDLNRMFSRYFPSIVVCVVLLMLLSLYFGWLDRFFWACEHAHVQGIDYFALPKSFLNLLAQRSPYDTWGGDSYGPYATWYLAHPLFSVIVMPLFSFLPPWLSYIAFVFFSLLIMTYCGYLYAKDAVVSEATYYYGFFLLAFPVYWMFYVGNMHAPLVLSLALILLALYEFAYVPDLVASAERKLFAGLLISLFTKPLVILLLPALLIVPETRKITLKSLFIYVLGSFLVLALPFLNPESIGWTRRFSLIFDISYMKENLNIYKNHFILIPEMKDNIIHWLNLIAQSGYRFNHIENFSFPVFLDDLWGKELPGYLYFFPLLFSQFLALGLFFVRQKQERLIGLLWLSLLSSTSYFLSYNTIWEYQYASMLPVVAILFRLRSTHFVSQTMMRSLLFFSIFYFLPSFYWLLNKAQMDVSAVAMVRVSREIPTLALYLLICYGLIAWFFSIFRQQVKSHYFSSSPQQRVA